MLCYQSALESMAFLRPWGRNDGSFLEAGARAYLADISDAELHLFDGGHFLLDEKVENVAGLIRDFIQRRAR
jgi:surfactin synthase thioesterase subunit